MRKNENKRLTISGHIAISIIKFSCRLLRLLGRGGTAIPGKIGMRICPDVLSFVSAEVDTVIVTGTNGKTTTANMIESALSEMGLDVLANKSGANLLSGITTEYSRNFQNGKPDKKIAVIECDEGALKYVMPMVRPKVLVVTNIFSDQLDRYGDTQNILNAIKVAVEACAETTLVLNADESLSASLALCGNNTLFYGIDIPLGNQEKRKVSDATHCQFCGSEYAYRYHTYAHLGGFYCPTCSYQKKNTDIGLISIESMDRDTSYFTLRIKDTDVSVKLGLPAVYNIYNALAGIGGVMALGYDYQDMIKTLGHVHSAFGRMEKFVLGGNNVRMILIKNPVGGNQIIEYLEGIDEDFVLVYALNDNTGDGTDISWIWDMECERLAGMSHIKRIITCGKRKEDMAHRLRKAGLKDVEIACEYKTVLDDIKNGLLPAIILPNYTCMLTMRELLKKETGGKDYWEKL